MARPRIEIELTTKGASAVQKVLGGVLTSAPPNHSTNHPSAQASAAGDVARTPLPCGLLARPSLS